MINGRTKRKAVMMKRFTGIAGIIGIFMFFMAALYAEKDSIQIKGSDTMVNLGQAWAEAFMEKYPDSFVAVTGGGSGTGIAALLSKTCNIAASSRRIKPKEIEQAEKNGVSPKEFSVALDGLAV